MFNLVICYHNLVTGLCDGVLIKNLAHYEKLLEKSKCMNTNFVMVVPCIKLHLQVD